MLVVAMALAACWGVLHWPSWGRPSTKLSPGRKPSGSGFLACDVRGSPTQITLAVKAAQTLHYWTRDPFGTNEIVTGS